MEVSRHLGFYRTANSAFDPPTLKTLALNQNGVDRMHRLRDIRL